ncbi:hypothetical protein [Burkholderia sp. Tr-20390]|uniref:hypothetical protein n=1 Tax=Burkholderia sp. Tr-20390 TaxID=2703904 RepID=UPI00197D5B76|nr:hypothetical protein [Burkholderia sp. Tr-20390]MBN3729450.1 hypothetical protein [Burkholderia sp. Tr-20390]
MLIKRGAALPHYVFSFEPAHAHINAAAMTAAFAADTERRNELRVAIEIPIDRLEPSEHRSARHVELGVHDVLPIVYQLLWDRRERGFAGLLVELDRANLHLIFLKVILLACDGETIAKRAEYTTPAFRKGPYLLSSGLP